MTGTPTAGPTILLVEDDEATRVALARDLAAHGYRVEAVADGQSALTRWGARRPDAVLLDLGLPDMDGIVVIRRIRREALTPILVLSARDSESTKVEALELGADDYVTKPFSLRELSARVRAVLRRGESSGTALPPNVELGVVQVDLPGHRVLRNGAEIPMKPKVFELLAFLLRHPGQVMSRDQLLERVWGYDYLGETRTVDVHVHWLRAAVEVDPARPTLIQTVRGTGYVLRRPA